VVPSTIESVTVALVVSPGSIVDEASESERPSTAETRCG
jgi:hypothetical protein